MGVGVRAENRETEGSGQWARGDGVVCGMGDGAAEARVFVSEVALPSSHG